MFKKYLLILSFSFISLFTYADEGMWLLMLIERLNHRDMQKEGLQLTADEIYSINHSSLKDAIVSFNGFCTGEIISDQGLILTNHHCGDGFIAELSDVQNNYLKDGFWAKNKSQEKPPKDIFVRFFIRMDDVSGRINALLNHTMTETQRQQIIQEEIAKIEKENNENGKYKVEVKSFFNGNEFYYFVYQDFTDVRLVAAPPANIGKFGGDTDNWEWPRHTGDFSMFRVYCDKNGNPADYSPENIPYTPKHSLPINIADKKLNDFTMILGYPGRTNRYLTSYGINQLIIYEYPAFIKASEIAMKILKKNMDKSEKIKIDYSNLYSGLANYEKNRKGTIESIVKNNTVDKKLKLETQFLNTVYQERNPNKVALYAPVLDSLKYFYSKTNLRVQEQQYLRILLRSSAYASKPALIGGLFEEYFKADDINKEKLMVKIKDAVDDIYKTLDQNVEEQLFYVMTEVYNDNVDPSQKYSLISDLYQKNSNGYNNILEVVKNSIFLNRNNIDKFMANPSQDILNQDKLYSFSKQLTDYYKTPPPTYKNLNNTLSRNSRLYLDELRSVIPSNQLYPDANFTMRLTYGTVKELPRRAERPNDATLNFYTTLEGMIAKYKPNDEEFDAPKKLLELAKNKDYGQYAGENGQIIVNFLSNNDITGGNSGSPVMNGKGELIGVAFDGNSEALSGDIVYESNLQRTINVDIRYVLFIIDKFAGATNLINEMKLVK